MGLDRFGNLYPDLAGMNTLGSLRVVENDTLTVTVTHMRERKWAHRKMWKKSKRFNTWTTEKASRDMYRLADGTLVMHPDTAKQVRDAAKQINLPVSMGSVHTPVIAPELPEYRPQHFSDYEISIRNHTQTLINFKPLSISNPDREEFK